MAVADILIVDDEADIRDLVAGILEDEGYTTRTAGGADEALAEIEKRRPTLIFLDIWLQGSRLDGLELLDQIRERLPDIPVVMISGHGTIETAVSAIKRGAYEYIEKPFKVDRLVLITQRAIEASRLRREVRDLRQRTGDPDRLIGRSACMNQLRQTIERIAPTNSRVLIVGQAGAGKELVARTLHSMSARAEGPFVVINAAAITPERMEEALFGRDDANGNRLMGAMEEADGGTLFIDEIADMPKETQNRILRVLVEQNFARPGSNARVHVDVRVISSTSRDLEEEVASGRFREDLFHRLSVVPVRVPPLSEHREDIPELIQHFMKSISMSSGLPIRSVGDDAMAVLQSHDWPGNIRQLRNNVERLMILAGGDPDSVITAEMLPAEVTSALPPTPGDSRGETLMSLPLREAREVFEREYLIAQISRFSGNVSRTAEFVGMERSALHRKLKSLGIG